MSEILEVIMLICFGLSWPINAIKAYKARTAKGKSLWFLLLIISGYIAGITAKLINEAYMASFDTKWYVLCFYILNMIMVCTDLGIYFRNRKFDKETEEKGV